jgi:hypothetical protein
MHTQTHLHVHSVVAIFIQIIKRLEDLIQSMQHRRLGILVCLRNCLPHELAPPSASACIYVGMHVYMHARVVHVCSHATGVQARGIPASVPSYMHTILSVCMNVRYTPNVPMLCDGLVPLLAKLVAI